MNAALQRVTWGTGTRKNERWSRYHAFYYPDAVCVPSLLLFFPFHVRSVLLSLRFFLCPFAIGPQEEKFSKKLGWRIRKVPRKRRKVMVSFLVANQAEGQTDCNLFLSHLAFFQAVQPSAPLAPADAVSFVLQVAEFDTHLCVTLNTNDLTAC